MIPVISWRQISKGRKTPWRSELLTGSGPVFAGRSRENFIQLDDLRVSRRHLGFQVEAGQVLVSDFGSSNGATLNGKPFQTAFLRPGDKLLIADFEFRLEFAPASAREAVKIGEAERTKARSPNRGADEPAKANEGGRDGAAKDAARRPDDARRGGGDGRARAVTDRATPGHAKPDYAKPEKVRQEQAKDARPKQDEAGAKLSRAVGYAAPEHAVAGAGPGGGAQAPYRARYRVTPVMGLGLVSLCLQAALVAMIVLASVVMTVKSILVSVSGKTSEVESKVKEVVSDFGIDLGGLFGDGEGDRTEVSAAFDPWETAASMDEYQAMILAILVLAGVLVVLFAAWQSLAERSLPGVFGNTLAERVASSPLAWVVPAWNLVQPPLSLVRIGGRAIACEGVEAKLGSVVVPVAVMWISALSGALLMWAGSAWPPQDLDLSGGMVLVAGPLLVVVGCAVAASLVGRVTRTILRVAALQRTANGDRSR